MMHLVLAAVVGAAGPHYENALRANALITRMVTASGAHVRHTAQVSTILHDFSHPKHAGDAWEGKPGGTLVADASRATLSIELQDAGDPQPDRYALRDGVLLQWKDNTSTADENASQSRSAPPPKEEHYPCCPMATSSHRSPRTISSSAKSLRISSPPTSACRIRASMSWSSTTSSSSSKVCSTAVTAMC